MPDVILPVLNEREAIPWVLERMPAGYAPIVVDNGSTDGSGELAASLGARVVVEPVPGFGAACFAGLSAADDDVVCFMDCDASFDPRELPRVADPVAGGRGGPDARRAPADRARRVAAARAGGEHGAGGRAAPAHEGAAARPRPDARGAAREALLDLGIRDRRFGWPLEMVLRAAAAGWTIREVARRLPPARREARRSRAPCAGPSARCAT